MYSTCMYTFQVLSTVPSALRVKKVLKLMTYNFVSLYSVKTIQCENTSHITQKICFVNIAVGIVTCDHCPRNSCQEIHTFQM